MRLFKHIAPSVDDVAAYATKRDAFPTKAVPFVWHYIKAFRVPIGLCSLCFVLASVISGSESYFLGRIIGEIAQTPKELVWSSIGGTVGLYILLVQVTGRLLRNIGSRIETGALPLIKMAVQRDMSSHLFERSLQHFQNDLTGTLGGKVTEAARAVRDIVFNLLVPFLFSITNLLTALALFSYVHWIFGLVAICYIGADAFLYYRFLPPYYRAAERAAEFNQSMRGRYIDCLSNILLVKVFVREQYEEALLDSSVKDVAHKEKEAGARELSLWQGKHFINALLVCSVLLLSLFLYQRGTLTVAGIATLLPLSALLSTQSLWLLEVSTYFFSFFAVVENSLKVLAPSEARPAQEEPPAKAPPAKWKGDIVFNNLHFAYNRDSSLFQGLQLHIKAGQKVGLVGPSGAGKSTILSLLLRFYDVDENEILIDRQNIRRISPDSLRQNIAVIPQDTALFHRSLMENIRYGRLDATDEDVIEAAKMARAHDFIVSLPDGYETLVGERGSKLSGGQRQRIAIARAILKEAPIIVLDEATSALDSESEAAFRKSFEEIIVGKTVIAIAHRLSTIAQMDWLIVLDSGKIVEQGSHDQLLKMNGAYARMWNLQMAGFIR